MSKIVEWEVTLIGSDFDTVPVMYGSKLLKENEENKSRHFNLFFKMFENCWMYCYVTITKRHMLMLM